MMNTRSSKKSSKGSKSSSLKSPLEPPRIRLVNDSCSNTYDKIELNGIILEKRLDSSSGFEDDLIWFSKFKLGNIFDGLGQGFDSLTKAFYANIHDINHEKMEFKTMIGREKLVVNRELISKLTEIPLGEVRVPRPVGERPSQDEIALGLCRKKVAWFQGKFPTTHLDVSLRVFGKLGIANLCPTTIENSWWSYEFAELVFLLVSGMMNLDICGFIVYKMFTMTSSKKMLGYPCLISRICKSHGVDPIGNSLGLPKLVRPCTIRRLKENVLKRQRDTALDIEEPTALELIKKIHKGVCKVDARVKCLKEQIKMIGEKCPELKEGLESIQASWKGSDDEDEE